MNAGEDQARHTSPYHQQWSKGFSSLRFEKRIEDEYRFRALNAALPQIRVAVVAAIVEYGDQHVILAHNKDWPIHWYGLITGFLEKHEDPEKCVIREVKEELGLEGEILEFVGHYTFVRMNQIIMAFHVKA